MKQPDDAIEALNGLLRGELSACETYRQAIDRIKDAQVRDQLLECERSHEQRVELLKQRIVELGGEPSSSSGPWGFFARAVEGGAALAGDDAAVAALEEGEDHGLADYRDELDELDPDSRVLVERQLLPLQQQTHDTVSLLKRTLH